MDKGAKTSVDSWRKLRVFRIKAALQLHREYQCCGTSVRGLRQCLVLQQSLAALLWRHTAKKKAGVSVGVFVEHELEARCLLRARNCHRMSARTRYLSSRVLAGASVDENLLSGIARRPKETHAYVSSSCPTLHCVGYVRRVKLHEQDVVGISRRATPTTPVFGKCSGTMMLLVPLDTPGRTSGVHAEWWSTRNLSQVFQPNRRRSSPALPTPETGRRTQAMQSPSAHYHPQHSNGTCAEFTAKTTNRSPRTKRVEPAPSDTKFLAWVDKHRRIRQATRKFFSEPLRDFSCDLGHLVGD